MQQETTIRTTRQVGPRMRWGTLVLVVVVIGAVAAGWTVSRSQVPTSSVTSPAGHQPQSRRFADEAAYVPMASDYASHALREDYLPVSLAVPGINSQHQTAAVSRRILSDELASPAHMLRSGEAGTEATQLGTAMFGPRS